MVENRIAKRKKVGYGNESETTKRFFDDSIAKYSKLTKKKKGFFD